LKKKFEWRKFIQGMFSETENVTITENEPILIEDFKYLVEASRLYARELKTNLK
jgi:hypothetical protein